MLASAVLIVGVHPLAGFDKLLHYRFRSRCAAPSASASLVRVPVRRAMCLGIVGEIGGPQGLSSRAVEAGRPGRLPVSGAASRPARARPLDGGLLRGPARRDHRDDDPAAVRRGMGLKEETLLAGRPQAGPGRGGRARQAGARSRPGSTPSSRSSSSPSRRRSS